ncbi:helix-turn-helix domain-containing protein [Candidatus Nitrospira bockiana]
MNDTVLTATTNDVSGQMMETEILTVGEVARFLRVPKSTVYKLARLGDLPASKVGKHWRFLRQDVQRWISCRAGRT